MGYFEKAKNKNHIITNEERLKLLTPKKRKIKSCNGY